MSREYFFRSDYGSKRRVLRMPTYEEMLLKKLPVFDPAWPSELRDMWFVFVEQLAALERKKRGLPEPEYSI